MSHRYDLPNEVLARAAFERHGPGAVADPFVVAAGEFVQTRSHLGGTAQRRLVVPHRPQPGAGACPRALLKRDVGLGTWKVFSSKDLLNSLAVERMLADVATRRHRAGRPNSRGTGAVNSQAGHMEALRRH
ncbi:MAG: hypothetical protein ACYCS7_04970 [Acidimicrobiales bacterium]